MKCDCCCRAITRIIVINQKSCLHTFYGMKSFVLRRFFTALILDIGCWDCLFHNYSGSLSSVQSQSSTGPVDNHGHYIRWECLKKMILEAKLDCFKLFTSDQTGWNCQGGAGEGWLCAYSGPATWKVPLTLTSGLPPTHPPRHPWLTACNKTILKVKLIIANLSWPYPLHLVESSALLLVQACLRAPSLLLRSGWLPPAVLPAPQFTE